MEKMHYFNRELSWLEFNARVLEEGLDHANPLLERLRFMSIVSSNFDEFFMVRVAAIKARLRAGDLEPDFSGLAPDALLEGIASRVREIGGKQYACLKHELFPALANEGLVILRPADYDIDEYRWLEDYFTSQVAPALTPLAVPASGLDENPGDFPTTGNLRIHAAFSLHADDGEGRLAIVQVPSNMQRFVGLPIGKTVRFALLDDLVMFFGHRLFPGYTVNERTLFKVTRDADVGVDEDRDDDFIAAMEEVLVNRQNSWPVRLSISADSEELQSRIALALGLGENDVYPMEGPIDLKGFMELANLSGFERLRFPVRQVRPPFVVSEDNTVWDEIRKRDIVLHLPYESFSPVVDFVETAATDPAVIAIKMTLYRTSGDSPIVKALTRAARSGKQVTAVVELKARFDEEQNIAWSSRLEQAGAIVVYGAARLKVHAKAILVVRREEDGLARRYVHLSTGNYNDRTARLYGDLSLFTANPTICAETGLFFNMITGLSALSELRHMSMAPFDLKRRIVSMIDRESERSSPESPGLIAAKMNSLCDREIIDALYRASRAGVKIMLNVRGICQLVPGLKGLSENITVVSVIGRYLEHARICYFRNGGAEELYLSSADWMTRNLDKRIELLFPVYGDEASERVYDLLMAYFLDNAKARALVSSGHWHRVNAAEGEARFSVQEYFHEDSGRRLERANVATEERVLQVRRRAP
ncbi:MAG: polyphosphate kinase 1 [Spirochaetae bacterium HGW-Spirochaetae-7]|nr:MAG: polyphosphate kinase 1 [Spirochaetae bacterium HGW-Spirochaetae-7]